MRYLCAELCKFLRSLEKFNDLLKLFLFLVRACNIVEGNAVLAVGSGGLDARFSEGVHSSGTVLTAAELVDYIEPEADKGDNENDCGKICHPPGRLACGNVICFCDSSVCYLFFYFFVQVIVEQ